MNESDESPSRPIKKTVLAFGEGEDEKIFLRHLVELYCRRDKVSVASSYAGGGSPQNILEKAIRFRRGEKRDYEFILLDTDLPWPQEMIDKAAEEEIDLIGNHPCLEAFFLEILNFKHEWTGTGSGSCKNFFKTKCSKGSFDEDECKILFPKALLNEVRGRNEKLNKIIEIIEGVYF